MPSYIWHGIDHSGKKIQGKNEADNRRQLKTRLIEQNIFPLKIKSNLPPYLKFNHKIKSKHITYLLEQLSILINANLPIIKAFTIISQEEQNPKLQKLVNRCKQSISTGKSLSQTMREHPQYFDELTCNLIKASEQSGNLDIVLSELVIRRKNIELQKRRIIKALLYPAAILGTTIIVTTIMLLFVIPQFASMFDNFGAPLPGYTQFIINLSNLLKKSWEFILATSFSCAVSIKIALHKSDKFRQLLDKLSLKIPVTKNILTNDIVSRLTNTLGLMSSSGVPLLKSLEITSSTISNFQYRVAIQKASELVANGETLHHSLHIQNIFPVKMVRLIALGEETGRLDSAFKKISAIYNEELNHIIDNLNNLLEPVIMLILGSLVGSLVIGMYLPIFRLGV